jgi:dolichol-phosphate mannosyltransferase
MKLSIIIPVYNEEKTISKVLERVFSLELGIDKEIVIVDDGSTDSSIDVIHNYLNRLNGKVGTGGIKFGVRDFKKGGVASREFKVGGSHSGGVVGTGGEFKFISKKNGGKGSAVRRGIKESSGDIITIQDADLEYDPGDFKKLIQPIIRGKEKVVYGSRFLGEHEPLYKLFYWGNKFLTFLTGLLYRVRITDMETCYKVFRADEVRKLGLVSNGFDIEPEITAKFLRRGVRIKEIAISYNPRSVEEGKKIGWRDGVKAIWVLFYYKLLD